MPPIIQSTDENVTVRVLARIAMIAIIPLFGLTSTAAGLYLNARFSEIHDIALAATQTAAASSAATVTAADNTQQLRERVDVIEANMTSSATDRVNFQNRMTLQVDKLTDVVQATSIQLSGISATLGKRDGQPPS